MSKRRLSMIIKFQKIIKKKGGENMKKLMLIGLIIVLFAFFSIPTFIFADTGDASDAKGEDGTSQYYMNPDDSQYTEVPSSENDYMEVYCIDETIGLTSGDNAYIQTNTNVSDELIANGENPDNAEAVEIMATTATGATNKINQEVVWEFLNNNNTYNVHSLSTNEKNIALAVENAVLALATAYNDLPANNNGTTADDITLQAFMETEGINAIQVILDDPSTFIDETTGITDNTFTAEVVMENPLVPGVTDGTNGVLASGTKTVFWYILEGSYNVSFAENSLLTQTTSQMTDVTDSNGDHDGKSNVPYYFYWWGSGYPEWEEMSVNIGACVDIDMDAKIDKEVGQELNDFNAHANVVENDGGFVDPITGEIIIAEQAIPVPAVDTFVPSNLDVDYYNAGKVLLAYRYCIDDYKWYYSSTNKDVPSAYHDILAGDRWYDGDYDNDWVNGAPSITLPAGYYDQGNQGGSSDFWYKEDNKSKVYTGSNRDKPQITLYPDPYYQRFTIESYNEPCSSASQFMSRWLDFIVNKTETGSVPALPVDNAIYSATYVPSSVADPYDPGRLINTYPYVTVFSATTGASGTPGAAKFMNLPWGKYSIIETFAPAGYTLDLVPKEVSIGGDSIFDPLPPELYGFIDVTDDPIPGPGPTPTPGGGGGAVAGLTGGTLQVLAFTGIDPNIPIAGGSAVIAGLAMLIVTLRRRADARIPSQLRFIKIDSVTGKPVPGAKCNIYNNGGRLVETITTGPDGWADVTLQNRGTYTVKG
jgi:hypothetical protein